MSESAAPKRVRVFRAAHDKDNPYFMARRDTAQDKTLTYEARGMLHYILSKPDTWEIMVGDLECEGTKRDRAYRILGELIRRQYVKRTGVRKRGQFVSIEYEVYESPYTEKPDTAKPFPVNPPPDIKEVKKVQKKDSLPQNGNGNHLDKPKKETPRNPFLDAIVRHIIGVDPLLYKKWSFVNKLKNQIIEADATATGADVLTFAKWCHDSGFNPPNDADKLYNNWLKWRTEIASAAPKQRIYNELPEHLRAPAWNLDDAP